MVGGQELAKFELRDAETIRVVVNERQEVFDSYLRSDVSFGSSSTVMDPAVLFRSTPMTGNIRGFGPGPKPDVRHCPRLQHVDFFALFTRIANCSPLAAAMWQDDY